MEISISPQALEFIQARKLRKPIVLIYQAERMKIRWGAGDPMGFHSVPSYDIVVRLLEADDVGEVGPGFVQVESLHGIKAHLAETVAKILEPNANNLRIRRAGFWKFKRLVADLVPSN